MLARVSATIPYGAARNNCYLCHGGQRTRSNGEPDRFIDTGIVIEFEGGLAICETCITYMGRLLGLLTPADVEMLTDELREVLEANVTAERRIADLVRRNEALRVLLGERLGEDDDAFDHPQLGLDAPPEEEATGLDPAAAYEQYRQAVVGAAKRDAAEMIHGPATEVDA